MFAKTNLYTYNHWCFTVPSTHPKTFMTHSHIECEFIYFEKGEAIYNIEGRRYRLHKNDLIFIRPLKYHKIEFIQDSEYIRYNVAFNPLLISDKLIDRIPERIEVINCPPEGMIAGIFKRMDYYCLHLDRDAFSEILSGLMTELLYNLSFVDTSLVNTPADTSLLLTEVLEFINKNLFSIRHVQDISGQFYISEQNLFRLFQKEMRTSPLKYINQKRLGYAQNMLRQGHSPTDVFQMCGFESYAGFYKQYKKVFGYAPSAEMKTEAR